MHYGWPLVAVSAVAFVAAAGGVAATAGSAADASARLAAFSRRWLSVASAFDVPGPASVEVSGVPDSASLAVFPVVAGTSDPSWHFPCSGQRDAPSLEDLWDGPLSMDGQCSRVAMFPPPDWRQYRERQDGHRARLPL